MAVSPLPRKRGGDALRRARTASGALRLTHTVGAAVAGRRVIDATEGSTLVGGALALSGVAAAAFYKPHVLAWPLGAIAAWCAIGLASRYATLLRERLHRATART